MDSLIFWRKLVSDSAILTLEGSSFQEIIQILTSLACAGQGRDFQIWAYSLTLMKEPQPIRYQITELRAALAFFILFVLQSQSHTFPPDKSLACRFLAVFQRR